MSMHLEAEKSLRQKLKSAFQECLVSEKKYIDFPIEGWVWKAAEQANKSKSAWLSSGEAYGVILNTTADSISHKTKDELKDKTKLTEILSATELDQLENKIVEYFKSIPRNYSLYLKVSRTTASPSDSLKISNKISLVQVKDGDALLSLKASKNFDTEKCPFRDGNILIKIELSGYAKNSFDNDNALSEGFSLLKQVSYMGLRANIFKENRNNFWFLIKGRTECDLFLVDETASPHTCTIIRAPSYSEKLLECLSVDEETFQVLADPSEGIKNLAFVCDQPYETSSVGYLKTAAEWAFESSANPDRTNSFIQLCVALEAILGEDSKQEIGLTEQLSDRCAFYIGTDMKSRQRIRDNFRDLYQHRSKLVHGRKAKLSADDYTSYDWGKKILDYIFMKELRNIKRGQE